MIEKNFYRYTTALCLINTLLLIYTAWTKYNPANTNCESCNGKFLFLPISDAGIALIGAGAALMLCLLMSLSLRFNWCKYLSLIIAALCAVIASALQFSQFKWAPQICYYCLISAIIFYVIFGILAYTVTFNHIINPKN